MAELLDLVRTHPRGVLVTLKRDGRPQLSNVSHHLDEAGEVLRISVTDDRAKTRNLRRDPRASYHVSTPDLGAYAVVEGTATLTDVASDPHDATVDQLVQLYRDIAGEHPDWDEYRAAMVADKRLVVRVSVDRVYGWAGPNS